MQGDGEDARIAFPTEQISTGNLMNGKQSLEVYIWEDTSLVKYTRINEPLSSYNAGCCHSFISVILT